MRNQCGWDSMINQSEYLDIVRVTIIGTLVLVLAGASWNVGLTSLF